MKASRPVRQAGALALLFVAAWAAWALLGAPLLESIVQDQDRSARSRALLVRYKQFEANLPELHRRIEALKASSSADPFLPALAPSLASTQVQSVAEQMVTSSGAILRSSRTLPRTEEAGYGRYGLDLDLTATTAALSTLLHTVESARPALVVERLSVQVPENGATSLSADNQAALTVNLRLVAFARGPR